jgi:hypothetical protein
MVRSAAAAALFAVLGARRVDQRLVQAGYRPRDLVVGRLVAPLGISTLLAVLFGVVMTIGSRPARVGRTLDGRTLDARTLAEDAHRPPKARWSSGQPGRHDAAGTANRVAVGGTRGARQP